MRHMDSKLESTRELVRAIHDESKDFNNKLIRQDFEFKSKILELQSLKNQDPKKIK
jgi:hypothetical protein